MDSPMMAMCLPAYQKATDAAIRFELRMRLTADRSAVLAPSALEKLQDLSGKVIAHYKTQLTDDERDLIESCVEIRNNLLHLSLSRATGQLKTLGETLEKGKVFMINIRSGDTADVADTSTKTGRIYGWMLQATASGAFAKCIDVCDQGIKIVERLTDEAFAGPPDGAANTNSTLPIPPGYERISQGGRLEVISSGTGRPSRTSYRDMPPTDIPIGSYGLWILSIALLGIGAGAMPPRQERGISLTLYGSEWAHILIALDTVGGRGRGYLANQHATPNEATHLANKIRGLTVEAVERAPRG